MQDPVSSHQLDASGIPTKPNILLGETRRAPAKCEGTARSGRPKAKSHRITFRVADDVYQGLMARSRDQGCDLSHVLRDALNGSLTPEIAPNQSRKPMMWPAEIEPLVHDYRAMVDKDPRHERRRIFGHVLAISVVCKEKFPRTPGVVDGYHSLLELQHLFGYGENV
jgi:hypothetical protein